MTPLSLIYGAKETNHPVRSVGDISKREIELV